MYGASSISVGFSGRRHERDSTRYEVFDARITVLTAIHQKK